MTKRIRQKNRRKSGDIMKQQLGDWYRSLSEIDKYIVIYLLAYHPEIALPALIKKLQEDELLESEQK